MAVARKPVVLVIDDDPMLLRAEARTLGEVADVMVATNAADALRLLGDRVPDAVVSDYDMPGATGIEFLSTARDSYPGAKRVLTSGSKVPDLEAHVASGLVEAFVEKPATADALQRAVGLAKATG